MTSRLLIAMAAGVLAGCPYCPDNGDPPFPDEQTVVVPRDGSMTSLQLRNCHGSDPSACAEVCRSINEGLPVRQPEEYEYGYYVRCNVTDHGSDWLVRISYHSNVEC